MKKLWIGVGASIAVIVIGGATAQRVVPDYTAPIRNLAGGLCIMIPLLALMGIMGRAMAHDLRVIKGILSRETRTTQEIRMMKDTKLAVAVFLLFESILLGAVIFGGVRVVKAVGDLVNGPKEAVIVAAMLEEDRDRGYKGAERIQYYLVGVTDDEEHREVKLTVLYSDLEEVKAVLSDAKWDYGLEARYQIRYFAHVDSLCRLQVIK